MRVAEHAKSHVCKVPSSYFGINRRIRTRQGSKNLGKLLVQRQQGSCVNPESTGSSLLPKVVFNMFRCNSPQAAGISTIR